VEDTPDVVEEGTAETNRAAILADTVKHWNNFIRGLLSATKAWSRYRETRLDNSVHVEEFPLEIQRHFVKANPHGDLDLIIEDIMTQPRAEEYLKTLFVSIEKEK
jgi:hypothetical protein